MTEAAAAEVYRGLTRAGARCWVVGGWGVDALVGRCTRPHKDLDVLLVLSEHEVAWDHLHGEGYRLVHRWEENLDVPGRLLDGGLQPTAYVLENASGRAVDVHVLDDRRPEPVPLWSTDRDLLPGALDAVGTIGGVSVRCMSAQMQLVAHRGYDLPPEHADDVVLLEHLAARLPRR